MTNRDPLERTTVNVIGRNLASPAMIVACVALIVALGGVSYAAAVLPKNSVGTAQLKSKAVSGEKLKRNAVTAAKVKDGSLLAADFGPDQLPAGPQGPKGDKGVPGAKGETGAPATTKRTLLTKDAGAMTASPAVTWAQHETIGTFTKDAASTVVRLTWTGAVHYDSLFCHFQIRIDGAAENGSTSTSNTVAKGGVVSFPNVGGQNAGPFSSYSVWSDLAAGIHTVTVWVRGPATGTQNCATNPGGTAGSTRVYVEEGR